MITDMDFVVQYFSTDGLVKHIGLLKNIKKIIGKTAAREFPIEVSDVDFRDVDFQKVATVHGNDFFKGTKFINCVYSGCNLANLDLRNSRFESCNFAGATLDSANLKNAKFLRSNLLSSSLENILINEHTSFKKNTQFSTESFISLYNSLNAIRPEEKNLIKKNIFKNSDLQLVDFQKFSHQSTSILQDLSFEGANLRAVDFSGITLKNINFDNAVFDQAKLDFSLTDNISLKNTRLASEILPSTLAHDLKKQVKTSLKGLDFAYMDFNGIVSTYGVKALAGYDMSDSSLIAANMATLDLTETNLSGADISEIIIKTTKMTPQQWEYFYKAGVEDFSEVVLEGEPTAYLKNIFSNKDLRNPLTGLKLSENILTYLIKNNIFYSDKGKFLDYQKKIRALKKILKLTPIYSAPKDFNNNMLASLLQLDKSLLTKVIENANYFQEINLKLEKNKKYILTKSEEKFLSEYKKTLYEVDYPDLTASISEKIPIRSVEALITKLNSNSGVFILKIITKKDFEMVYIIKKHNKYTLMKSGVIYPELDTNIFLRLVTNYFDNINSKGIFTGASLEKIDNKVLYHESLENFRKLHQIKTENTQLRLQDRRYGDISIGNDIQVSRELLYEIGLQIKTNDRNKKPLSSDIEITQNLLNSENVKNNLFVDLDFFSQHLYYSIINGNDLKAKKLIDILLANQINFEGDKEFKFKLKNEIKNILPYYQTQKDFLSINKAFSPLQRSLLSVRLGGFIARNIKNKNYLSKTLLKNKQIFRTNNYILTTGQQIGQIKGIFDIFKGAFFSNKAEDIVGGVALFFTTTYGIPKLSNYVYKNSFWRSKLSGSIAISPELYVIADTIKILIKTKGKSYSGFIDLTSSVLSGYESLKNVVKNSPPDFIVPLALLSGNVLAKALGNYVENFDYSLTAYERFQMTWKAGLEIEDPYLTKLKESADYLERVYTSLGEELLSNSKLAGAAYGLGNKANAQSKGGNSQGVFEKLKQKSGENNLQNIRTEGRGIKARKPRLAPKRKRINEKTKAQVDAEQIDRHKKRLDSLPKSAEATIDLTYSPRDLWASRQNPPSVNNLLEELGGTRMLGEKNWAADPEQIDNWRGRSWLRRNQPAYFSACFNEFQSVSDSSGIKQFVSKFNVFGSCRNAIVVFSKKFQAALNKLAQLTPTDPKADEILRELQKLILPIDATLIDKGVVKGSNLGPINEITMGKGIAHYIGGNQNTQKNIFHLPETDYVGNIDGGVGASNILNASKLNATTVVYADSVLETIPKNSEATTSAISFFLGRKDLQEVVDCKKMPDISVNSQGGRIGALDQLFNCRYIKVSGFTDVESHLPGDYQLLIETESQGYISIHLPNAYKVNIIFPDILNVVKLGIFFLQSF